MGIDRQQCIAAYSKGLAVLTGQPGALRSRPLTAVIAAPRDMGIDIDGSREIMGPEHGHQLSAGRVFFDSLVPEGD